MTHLTPDDGLPDTHPLGATTSDGTAVWSCPADGTVISAIGGL